MKLLLPILLSVPLFCGAQIFTEETLLARLKSGGNITEDALSKRSVVLHSHSVTSNQLVSIHESLVRTGFDAVAYFKIDGVLAGGDVAQSYAEYFTKREISSLIVIQKLTTGYTIYITPFNGKEGFVNPNQPTWSAQSPSLNEALNIVYRAALASNKKKNLLINEIPEVDLPVRVIDGERAEMFGFDLKVDKLAVPNFEDPELDKKLDELFKTYPFPYQLTNHTVPDKELRAQGFLYVLCFVYTRSSIAKELLGYPVSKSESAFVSVTYPNGQLQLKTITADTPVYKFYVRHIDSGNVFLGTKWDAETTWEQAIQNFIKGFKVELRIN